MIFEVFGWIGAVLFISSYVLLSSGKLSQHGMMYHLLNLLGAICLVVNAIHFSDQANVLVNTVWAGIALLALVQAVKAYFRSKS
ncbi:hypothetical protein GCM10007049_38390 [Echinicola pacifica]|uniref:CBU-0592-like domain-containing protein n=1 Tax=Echinicola pacifica TaxID=346377 RepID=A0A918UY69_9BACT|nr:hypothetical protein [Echinicola pacifica]GGZ41429.1 hypothetical protein GCM10007049_38390 [Echinicola pacifica]